MRETNYLIRRMVIKRPDGVEQIKGLMILRLRFADSSSRESKMNSNEKFDVLKGRMLDSFIIEPFVKEIPNVETSDQLPVIEEIAPDTFIFYFQMPSLGGEQVRHDPLCGGD